MKDYEVVTNATVDFDNLETWEIAEIYGLDEEQEEIFFAAIETIFTPKDAIWRIKNDKFELNADVSTYEDLGYLYADILGLPEFAFDFFDFEYFGETIANKKNEDEEGWLTSYGWLTLK